MKIFLAVLMILTSFSPALAIDKIDIAVFGDSLSAGNGATNYYGEKGCYTSKNVYALKYKRKLRKKGYKASYRNLACSGSKTSAISRQIKKLTRKTRRKIDLVFVSMGANDIYFEDIVKQCFVPGLKDTFTCEIVINTAFALIGQVKIKMEKKIAQLAKRLPNARIVLVGYPYLLDHCPSEGIFSLGGYPSGEQVRALSLLAHSVASMASRISNLSYRVDYVSLLDKFKHHEICGYKKPWIRNYADTAITAEWFHPNKSGHSFISRYLVNRLGY